MFYEIKEGKRKDGTLKVRFRYRKNGVLKTVPSDEHPRFWTEEEVKLELPKLEAKYDHLALLRQERESWRDKYYNFDSLVEEYKKSRKDSVSICCHFDSI